MAVAGSIGLAAMTQPPADEAAVPTTSPVTADEARTGQELSPWSAAPSPIAVMPTYPALDEVYHPGETVAMSSIVAAAATDRVRDLGGSLTEAEMDAVLEQAGWPVELWAQAKAVAWCESRWSAYAVGDGGASRGLFQLNVATWFRYAGEDPAQWADPVVNARVALSTYRYDLARGYRPWAQWSCGPPGP